MKSALALRAAALAAALLVAMGSAGLGTVEADPPTAAPDTSGMTPLQKVLLKAKQMGAVIPQAASDSLVLPAGVRRVTTTPADEGSCAWSPDGKSLYFDRMESGRRQLVRLDLATGEVTPLNDPPREGFDPAVSPDGRYIVFVRNLPQLPHKLWVMRLEDGEEAKLTDDGGPLHEGDPAWSRSGGTVYYSQSNNGTPNATPMSIARTGENAQALNPGTGSYQNPTPGPSGDTLAWILRLGTTAFLRVTNTHVSALSEDFEFPGYFLSSADWLPGERRLVVSYLDLNAPLERYRLGIVDLDSKRLEPWLSLPNALEPRVSPDGRQVAFRAQAGGSYELFLAELP